MLIGHEERWRALARAHGKGRTPQTLLVSGPPGVGKTTFVLRYAQLLLCSAPTADEFGLPAPCLVCRACHQVEVETFPDYRVFRPVISSGEPTRAPEILDSSIFQIGKDEDPLDRDTARNVPKEALRKPVAGARKVLWLAQFDRAGDAAENALLKTLEEPPPSTHIVLTTDNARNLRPTILSRCWHLQLSPARDADVWAWLQGEFPDASPADLTEAVRAGNGRPGTARRALERLLESGESGPSRFQIATRFVERFDTDSPVGALGLTEEALKWAKLWWDEDAGDEGDAKKLGAKGGRAAMARFLDELAVAGRAKWLLAGGAVEKNNAERLDLMRQTREYILRNASTNLCLDVLFGRALSRFRVQRARGEVKLKGFPVAPSGEAGKKRNSMSQVAAVGEGNFESEVVRASVPVVVDFWADWCQPCKMLSPVLDRLAARYEGRLKVVKCNVDENHAIAGQFAISALPNLLFFKGGEVINQVTGYRGEEQLAQTIDEVLAT